MLLQAGIPTCEDQALSIANKRIKSTGLTATASHLESQQRNDVPSKPRTKLFVASLPNQTLQLESETEHAQKN